MYIHSFGGVIGRALTSQYSFWSSSSPLRRFKRYACTFIQAPCSGVTPAITSAQRKEMSSPYEEFGILKAPAERICADDLRTTWACVTVSRIMLCRFDIIEKYGQSPLICQNAHCQTQARGHRRAAIRRESRHAENPSQVKSMFAQMSNQRRCGRSLD